MSFGDPPAPSGNKEPQDNIELEGWSFLDYDDVRKCTSCHLGVDEEPVDCKEPRHAEYFSRHGTRKVKPQGSGTEPAKETRFEKTTDTAHDSPSWKSPEGVLDMLRDWVWTKLHSTFMEEFEIRSTTGVDFVWRSGRPYLFREGDIVHLFPSGWDHFISEHGEVKYDLFQLHASLRSETDYDMYNIMVSPDSDELVKIPGFTFYYDDYPSYIPFAERKKEERDVISLWKKDLDFVSIMQYIEFWNEYHPDDVIYTVRARMKSERIDKAVDVFASVLDIALDDEDLFDLIGVSMSTIEAYARQRAEKASSSQPAPSPQDKEHREQVAEPQAPQAQVAQPAPPPSPPPEPEAVEPPVPEQVTQQEPPQQGVPTPSAPEAKSPSIPEPTVDDIMGNRDVMAVLLKMYEIQTTGPAKRYPDQRWEGCAIRDDLKDATGSLYRVYKALKPLSSWNLLKVTKDYPPTVGKRITVHLTPEGMEMARKVKAVYESTREEPSPPAMPPQAPPVPDEHGEQAPKPAPAEARASDVIVARSEPVQEHVAEQSSREIPEARVDEHEDDIPSLRDLEKAHLIKKMYLQDPRTDRNHAAKFIGTFLKKSQEGIAKSSRINAW